MHVKVLVQRACPPGHAATRRTSPSSTKRSSRKRTMAISRKSGVLGQRPAAQRVQRQPRHVHAAGDGQRHRARRPAGSPRAAPGGRPRRGGTARWRHRSGRSRWRRRRRSCSSSGSCSVRPATETPGVDPLAHPRHGGHHVAGDVGQHVDGVLLAGQVLLDDEVRRPRSGRPVPRRTRPREMPREPLPGPRLDHDRIGPTSRVQRPRRARSVRAPGRARRSARPGPACRG